MTAFEAISAGLTPAAVAAAFAVTLFAGFVKGALGFAMPLIMISAFGSFMPAPVALAALILPTLTTNIHQALRQGWRAALASAVEFRRLIGTTVVFIALSAQFVPHIPQPVMLGLLGVPVILFSGVQLMGRSLALPIKHRLGAEYGLGVVAGVYGGISGVWGPPVLIFLLSIGVGKVETVRVQGVVFLIGAVVLMSAHLQSGVLNASTVPFSAALIVPAALGMWAGFRLQDRLDAARFRRWTLALLLLTGLNLLRLSAGI
ncbi:MAG: sulfite exporter TauE/SafE family protein [Gemmobacter sp.]